MTNKRLSIVALLSIAILASGCYRATVDTGLAPQATPTHSETTWAHSWIYGLVPPSTVRAQEACQGGQATEVTTQIGFVHGLVSALTGGIYTPMEITVRCARTT
jgi:hypothetical protein